MIYYSQSGVMFTMPDGTTAPALYAGNGQWKNDPGSQSVSMHGPLPQNVYGMTQEITRAHLGPSIELTPTLQSTMFGRDGFYIHGIDPAFPEDSSDGCICTAPGVRALIDGWILRGEDQLTVTE
jgi:hypothetical protein